MERLHRHVHGWSANLIQTILALTQQLFLVPVFLHFQTSDVLAAWLALYATGNVVIVADAGLQLRSINRFFHLSLAWIVMDERRTTMRAC